MKPILIAGSSIVTLALISYTISFFKFHRKKSITSTILTFQTTGLIFDVTATTLMIIGSENSPFTLHGMLGYSALTIMIVDTSIFWSRRRAKEHKSLLTYSTIAWIWWILAYITGSIIAMS
jgi:uncharacterized repeat protein (TIGR03987 family)